MEDSLQLERGRHNTTTHCLHMIVILALTSDIKGPKPSCLQPGPSHTPSSALHPPLDVAGGKPLPLHTW